MSKPKPIFTVGVPNLIPENLDQLSKHLGKTMPDYHVLVYITEDQTEFMAYYEKDFNEVKYEELKEIVKESIKKYDE